MRSETQKGISILCSVFYPLSSFRILYIYYPLILRTFKNNLVFVGTQYLWVHDAFVFCKQTPEITVYQISIHQKHLFMEKVEVMQASTTSEFNKGNRICNARVRCPVVQSWGRDAFVSQRCKYVRNVFYLLSSKGFVDLLRVYWDSCVILGKCGCRG